MHKNNRIHKFIIDYWKFYFRQYCDSIKLGGQYSFFFLHRILQFTNILHFANNTNFNRHANDNHFISNVHFESNYVDS